MRVKIHNNVLWGLLLIVVFGYLGLNIFYSQDISPLYERVTVGDKEAVISYLRYIKPLSEFKSELVKYRGLFGTDIDQSVYKEDYERNSRIAKLEKLLEKNRNNPDVLFNLYLLNEENGDSEKATDYLKRAEEIDPGLK